MAELLGGAFLSSFLNVLFDRMATPEFLSLFKTRKMDMGLLQELKILLNTINGVLDDAESQRITNPAVEKWLDELRDAAYEADDILDFIAYEAATAAKAEAELTSGNQIWDLFTFRNPFKKATPQDYSEEAFSLGDVPERIEGIVKRIQLLVQQIDSIGLRQGASKEASIERETSSLVDESLIFGRDADREAIFYLLQEDDAVCNGIGVIPIVGIGGIGKTTLAQQIYNDDRVAKLFECRVWVCVSDNYDGVRIRKEIIKGVNNASSAGTCGSSLQQIDVELQQSLKDKKYLLVLDDIWDNAYDHWDTLLTPLKSGARGSKILITTRNQKIASNMGTIGSPHELRELNDDICWQIFEKHVFKGGKGDQRLESIGRKIASKCRGLPLAAKMLAGLLRGNQDEAEWVEILESKTWQYDDDKVLPALRLSYQHLPSHLKQCFAYCAIFPKDSLILKEELIELWMAEGFLIPPKREKKTEKWGEKCIQELVSRSFFQKHTFEYGGGSYFLMHDLINDLAQLVSGEFSVRMDGGDSCEFNSRNRYFSFSILDAGMFKIIDNIHKAKFLRTFCRLHEKLHYVNMLYGNTDQVVNKIVSRFRCLRVLSLCFFNSLTKLPDSIEHLKHLRYLNLAGTALERLPESVCTLYNLQILILIQCEELVELPENMGKLINLHRVDVSGATKLQKMPPGMGNLKHLVSLSDFILGKQGGSDLNELGKLQYLQGALSVSNLQNVVNIPNNILKNKKELEDLQLKWSGGSENSAHELSVLEQLQPYKSIKSLSIDGYGGTKFADWVSLSSYTNLVSLNLYGCENCFSLPPLGSLSYLEDLSISKFDAMVELCMEMPFKSLKNLSIRNMKQWENWSFCEENDTGKCGSLAKLKKLTIQDCPKLNAISSTGPAHTIFCSLNSLTVEGCRNLKISKLLAISNFKELPKENNPPKHPRKSKLERHNINQNPEVILEQLSSAMYGLHVRKLVLEGIEEMGVALNALEDVEIMRSELCECIPLEVLPVLKSLYVEKCCNLKSLSASGEPLPQPLTSLTSLEIYECESLIGFPKGGISAPNMTSLKLKECNNLKSLPEGMNVLLSSLKHLKIKRCEELESFPEGGLPASLQSLKIILCNDKLIEGCWQWGLQTLDALSSLKLINYRGDHLNCFPFPPALTSLEMVFFWDLKFMNCNLQHLTHLSIHGCPNLESFLQEGLASSTSAVETESVVETQSFQQGGLLPNLQSLHIGECDELIGRRLQWGLQGFNALSHLSLGGYEKDDLGSFPEESLLPSTLTSLAIVNFSKLEAINYKGLRHLTSLSQLTIYSCDKFRCLPEEGLPSSLAVLNIRHCRLLKERCERGKGQDWRKISHISTIRIDGKKI